MYVSTHTEYVMDALNIGAMSEIVRDLVAGDPGRLIDGEWLRVRTETARLRPHEFAALDALRCRLQEDGMNLLDAVGPSAWS